MTMKNPTPAAFRQARAFTIVETMLSVSIGLIVILGILVFTLSLWKTFYSDFNRLNINDDLRRFTETMETDAAFANTFYIYDINVVTNTGTFGPIPTTGTTDNFLTPGQSGDLVLLVSILTATSGTTTVDQIIAYYHDGTNASTGPMYRYSTGKGLGIAGTTNIYKLYHNNIETPLRNMITNKQIFMPSARVVGVATNSFGTAATHPNLFYFLWRPGTGNGAFKVQSQIKEQQNSQTVLAIDTYNFTIWPRS